MPEAGTEQGADFLQQQLELAARARIVQEGYAWVVPSQSGNGTYRVTLAPGKESCTCEDFQLRQQPCKHVIAARVVRERDHGGETVGLEIDAVPKRPTYKQVWALSNKGGKGLRINAECPGRN
jgi:hypothetical protein